jgi:thioredoxin 1
MVDSKTVVTANDADFTSLIEKGVTLVDFWAAWCMPCRIQGPIVEDLAEKLSDEATFAKLDVDSNPATAMQFGITGIPTLILFKDGREAKRFIGVQSAETLSSSVKSLLQDS